MIRVEEGDPRSAAARRLIGMAQAHSHALYPHPPESVHTLPAEALAAPHVRFLLAWRGDAAVGCAALVLGPDATAEVKSVFVDPQARGSGVARTLVGGLEARARRDGVGTLLLETGTDSHAAIALYTALGYTRRGPFADHRPDPLSVFMEKPLAPLP